MAVQMPRAVSKIKPPLVWQLLWLSALSQLSSTCIVSNVDNNTFTAYSNFYTHTQNMCYFLKVIWLTGDHWQQHPPAVLQLSQGCKGDGRVHAHAEGDCHWAARQPGVSETACSGWESPQSGCWGQQGARIVVRILVHFSFNISVWFKNTADDEYVQEFANWSMVSFAGSENWGPTPSVWGVQVEFWGNRGGQS